MRTWMKQDPFIEHNQEKPWQERGLWPCAWVECPGLGQPPFVTAYRRSFHVETPARVRVHVAADERYDLYLDGDWIGRGNERGAPDVWFYESYELALEHGEHVLVARVWSLGERAAEAQMSVRPGFLLGAEAPWTELLSTGQADWQAMRLDGYEFLSPNPAHWRGARIAVHGDAFPWGFERGLGQNWQPAQPIERAMGKLLNWEIYKRHVLRPATLPELINQPVDGGSLRFVGRADQPETQSVPVLAANHLTEEAAAWMALWQGQSALTVPAHSARRMLLDLENYYCAYSELVTSGGAGSQVRIHWAESLYNDPDFRRAEKHNRDAVEGKYFIGYGDQFWPDGGEARRFDSLWWMAGRYVEVFVQTGAQPLRIERLTLHETRYPLEMESRFSASDSRMEAVMPLMVRGMQMCSNETFFDCPYYEELQYAGDSRLEMLTTYTMTRDDRLPRKALRMFDSSRLASGLTQSRYPSRVMQIIPPFALWWVMMIPDYAFWRGDRDTLLGLMPGVRATLEGYERFMGADGLMYSPEGWSTIDWVPEWSQDAGVPPDGHSGASGLLNWQLVYTLALIADIETRLGEVELAGRCRKRALRLAEHCLAAFWDEQRGLLADDRTHTSFSEHTQCLALLASERIPDLLPLEMRRRVASGLLEQPDLRRATIYFRHYLFETYRALDRVDLLLDRLKLWYGLLDMGLKTPVEMPEPTRSDCHAWGAHPLFHYFATILGIRPAEFGFRSVNITPKLGGLEWARGSLVHPSGGEIVVAFQQEMDGLHGMVQLPEGLVGKLVIGDQSLELLPGKTTF